MRFVALRQRLQWDFPQGGVPLFSWPFPYEVYRLSCVSCCVPVLCCLMLAGVKVALCHVRPVFLLAPHVVCLLEVMVQQLVGVSAHLLVSPADQQRHFCIRIPRQCVVLCLLVPLPAYLAHVCVRVVRLLVCWCSMRARCIGAAEPPQRRVHCGICCVFAVCVPVSTCRRSFCTAPIVVRLR